MGLPQSEQRRFRRRPYRAMSACIALALLLVVQYWRGPVPPDLSQPLVEGAYRVRRVVDGDTIIVEPNAWIRLIGVNTPETVKPEHPVEPWGPEATQFTKHFLQGGNVRLTFDRERVDRFGRFLAYVWVGDEMLNEALVRAGLARFEPHFHYSEAVKRRFRRAQDEAKREGVGIWSEENVGRRQTDVRMPHRWIDAKGVDNGKTTIAECVVSAGLACLTPSALAMARRERRVRGCLGLVCLTPVARNL